MPRRPNSVHYQSGQDEDGSVEYGTPQLLFDRLNDEFHFTVDVAASALNHKLPHYYTLEENGLALPWANERVYINPPYGRGDSGIVPWITKANWEVQNPTEAAPTIVMLIPARTDARWWYEGVTTASEVRFIVGRLRFEGAKNSASFPSAVVIFRPRQRPVVTKYGYLALSPQLRGHGPKEEGETVTDGSEGLSGAATSQE